MTGSRQTALAADIYREAARDLDTDDIFRDAIDAAAAAWDADVAHHLAKPISVTARRKARHSFAVV